MSLESIILERLNNLTIAFNKLYQDARKTGDFTHQDTLDNSSLIRVTIGGTSQYVSISQIIQSALDEMNSVTTNYRGTYNDEAELISENPDPSAGSFAYVRSTGQPNIKYEWDDTDEIWYRKEAFVIIDGQVFEWDQCPINAGETTIMQHDVIKNGWWSNTQYVKLAVFNGGDYKNKANYTITEDI